MHCFKLFPFLIIKAIHIHCRIFGKYTGKIKIISNFSTQRETLTGFYSVFFPEVIHLYTYLLSFKIIQNKQQIHFCIFFNCFLQLILCHHHFLHLIVILKDFYDYMIFHYIRYFIMSPVSYYGIFMYFYFFTATN